MRYLGILFAMGMILFVPRILYAGLPAYGDYIAFFSALERDLDRYKYSAPSSKSLVDVISNYYKTGLCRDVDNRIIFEYLLFDRNAREKNISNCLLVRYDDINYYYSLVYSLTVALRPEDFRYIHDLHDQWGMSKYCSNGLASFCILDYALITCNHGAYQYFVSNDKQHGELVNNDISQLLITICAEGSNGDDWKKVTRIKRTHTN